MPPVTTPTPASRAVVGQQALGEDPGAGEGALLALPEGGSGGELEGHGLGGDDVLQRTALLAGEHRRVDLLGEVGGREDDAAARAAEGLVGGGGDDVGVRHGVRVQAGGDQPGEVRHVDHQVGAHLVGDPAELGEVQLAG